MTTTNTLVSLEEVRKYISICLSWDLTFLNPHAVVSGMDKIPTINPIEEIEKMQEQIKKNFPDNNKYTEFWKWLITGKLDSLNMLKSRLTNL